MCKLYSTTISMVIVLFLQRNNPVLKKNRKSCGAVRTFVQELQLNAGGLVGAVASIEGTGRLVTGGRGGTQSLESLEKLRWAPQKTSHPHDDLRTSQTEPIF